MKDELDGHNATAIVIGSGPLLSLKLATRWLRLPWPVVRDPDRDTYRGYGLERALGLVQRSGTFVIDAKGVLRYAHGGLNPGTAMHPSEIIAELDRLQA